MTRDRTQLVIMLLDFLTLTGAIVSVPYWVVQENHLVMALGLLMSLLSLCLFGFSMIMSPRRRFNRWRNRES